MNRKQITNYPCEVEKTFANIQWFCKYYCNIDRIHATGSLSTRQFSCYQELLGLLDSCIVQSHFLSRLHTAFQLQPNQIKILLFWCALGVT